MIDFQVEVMEAIAIINRCKNTGRPFGEFKKWDRLNLLSKAIAWSMFDFTPRLKQCDRCLQYKDTNFTPYTEWDTTYWECEDCTPFDAFEVSNYARVVKEFQRA